MDDLTISGKKPVSAFKSKKVLPMWEYSRFVVVPVDDGDGCRDQHILNTGKFHRYYDEMGRLHAARCPNLLSHDEKARVLVDDPPGSWEEAMEAQKAERLRAEAARRLAEKRAGYQGRHYGGQPQS